MIELDSSSRVDLAGDGSGLTPRDTGALLAHLARCPGIERDEYARGGVVEECEARFAAELEREAALFLPTGTLANHLALRAWSRGGGRAFAQAESHVYRDSGDALPRLSALHVVGLGAGAPAFTAGELAAALARNEAEKVPVPTRVLSIESPVRRFEGRAFPPEELYEVLRVARAAGLALHRDGARLFLEAAARGTSAAELARPFDSLYVSLHKCFDAPSGALLLGAADFIEPLRDERRMFGGAPAGAWPAAAIALHTLEGYAERIARAFDAAQEVARLLAQRHDVEVRRLEHGTHVVHAVVGPHEPEVLAAEARSRGLTLRRPAPEASPRVQPLHINASWLNLEPEELAQRLGQAIARAREARA